MGSILGFLVGVKYAKNVDGMSRLINSKGDPIREPLHGFATDIFITDGRSGRQSSDAVKVGGYQVSKPIAQIGFVICSDGLEWTDYADKGFSTD